MTPDPLKDLFAQMAPVPAHDLKFTLGVMARVEKARLNRKLVKLCLYMLMLAITAATIAPTVLQALGTLPPETIIALSATLGLLATGYVLTRERILRL